MTRIFVFGIILCVVVVEWYLHAASYIDQYRALFLACVVGGPLLVVGGAWRLFRSEPRIIVDVPGITDTLTGLGLIPWTQITAASVIHDFTLPFLCLTVIDAEAMRAKRGKARKAAWGGRMLTNAGPNDLLLPLGAIKAKPDEVLLVVERYSRIAATTIR